MHEPQASFSQTLYKKIKERKSFKEAIHCPMIIQTFYRGDTLPDFLVEAGISRQKFVAWQNKYPVFKETFMVARELGRSRWQKEGKDNVDNREFNSKVWEIFGRINFGGLDKISLFVESDASPHAQYQQLLSQATCGDFSSSELKQLMECVNIGIKAHEFCVMQDEINELKAGLEKMKERELEHQTSNTTTSKENKIALVG